MRENMRRPRPGFGLLRFSGFRRFLLLTESFGSPLTERAMVTCLLVRSCKDESSYDVDFSSRFVKALPLSASSCCSRERASPPREIDRSIDLEKRDKKTKKKTRLTWD